MLIGIKKDGRGLQYVNEELKNDKDIVMAAIYNNPYSLVCASERLKNDKDVVVNAVTQKATALYYASEELQSDKKTKRQRLRKLRTFVALLLCR